MTAAVFVNELGQPFIAVWAPITAPYLDPFDVARFVRRVDIRRGMKGCWLWQGRPGAGGYGRTTRFGINVGAHRFALEIELGRPLEPGLFACHTCDQRMCVNPGHLYEGTAADNNRDARARTVFRRRGPGGPRRPETILRGMRSPRAKLTDAQVLEIRAADRAISNDMLASIYGVHNSTIGRVRTGKNWTHVR